MDASTIGTTTLRNMTLDITTFSIIVKNVGLSIARKNVLPKCQMQLLMSSVVVLTAVMASVVLLNVVAPNYARKNDLPSKVQ